MRYIICTAITFLVVSGSLEADVQKITPWLLGINFTLAIFSINFTFFGHQLSKYKAIYSEVSKRQWLNIVTLMALPFIPLICFLVAPDYFGRAALWALPVLIMSAIDNATLTVRYLNPVHYMVSNFSDSAISRYVSKLSKEVKKETDEHQKYLNNRDKFQLPPHAFDFEPAIKGLKPVDLWDSITVITKQSIANNDYPVFRQSIGAILKLVIVFYSFKHKDKDSYHANTGVRLIARTRFRSIISYIAQEDKDGIFLQSLSSELCGFIMGEDALYDPCSDMTRSVANDLVWIGQKMLESNDVFEPVKILNTLHGVIELNVHRLEVERAEDEERSIDTYNISMYAYDIKNLGVTALNCGNSHFLYRCMESLSYLGCNAAKKRSTQTVVAVLESIVNLGRAARNQGIGCFWSRCLIPVESHAEEFMGHILTWLIQDLDADGNFYMKGYAEDAFSRLRGVKCAIKPKPKSGPILWIEEIEEEGEKVPHIEYESGMYGYAGQCDYSDFSNLKEYVLNGMGSGSTFRIFHSEPIPLDLGDEE